VIAVPVGVRVLVATKPVDFRRGAESLAALVREQLRHVAATEAAEDKKDPVGGARAPRSAAATVARFPPICRAFM
jgi:hypothetical protein